MRLITIVCLALAVAAPAAATPITFNFTGTLTSMDQRLSPGLAVGDAVSGTVMYDRDHPLSGEFIDYVYASFTWNTDDYTFGSGTGLHRMTTFSPLTGAVSFVAYFGVTPNYVTGDGYINVPDRFNLWIDPSTGMGSLNMFFDSYPYPATGGLAQPFTTASARLDSVTPVPEPSTFVLVASTIAFAVRRGLRRR